MPLYKSHLIDKRPWWVATLIAIGYLLSFIICVAVGGAGPGPGYSFSDVLQPETNLACANAAQCTVTTSIIMSGLSGYNQALWAVASIARPLDTSTGQLALAGASFQVPIDFSVTATGDGTVITSNASNTAILTCQANAPTCGYAVVFATPFLYYSSYSVQVTYYNPYSGFIMAGIAAQNINVTNPVGIAYYTGTVNPAFTRFQINSKYTFFCLSLIMYGVWIYFMLRGAGGRDPEVVGAKLRPTQEQVWMTVLGGWLIWANDPFAAVSLTTPSFAASGFYAVCAVTFTVLLLLYWLVIFDLARDPARAQLPGAQQPLGASAQLARRCSCSAFTAAVLFWAPKLLWSVVTWVLLVSFYLVQRAAALADPTFSFSASFPLLLRYFTSFLAAWGAIYVIYIVVLLISGLYQCRVIAPSSRYILAITIITLMALLAGFFGNGLLPVTASNSAVLFMTAQGAANVYIYFLMIAYLPAFAHSPVEAAAAAARDEEAAAAGGSALTMYGGIPEAAAKPKALSEAYSQTDESALQPGSEHGDCITMPVTIVAGPPTPAAAAGSPPPGLGSPAGATAGSVGGAFAFGNGGTGTMGSGSAHVEAAGGGEEDAEAVPGAAASAWK